MAINSKGILFTVTSVLKYSEGGNEIHNYSLCVIVFTAFTNLKCRNMIVIGLRKRQIILLFDMGIIR